MYISMFFVWTLVVILGVYIELNTQIQVGSGLAFGGVASIITHGITRGNPLWLEFLIFAIVWIIFWIILFSIFTLFRKRLSNKDDGFLKYVGKDFEVLKSNQDSEYGEIKINSTIFRFKNKEKIKKGETVRILSIKGVTCIVERI